MKNWSKGVANWRRSAWKLESANARPGDLVFCTVTGKPVSERSVNLALATAKKAAGLDGREDRLSTHALRHSFVSLAATNLDVPDTTLARLAGHANAAVTMRLYARDARDQADVNRDIIARAAQARFAE